MKIKKILIVLLLALTLISYGCGDKETPPSDINTPSINYNKIKVIVDDIDSLPLDIKLSDKELVEMIASDYEELSEEEKKYVSNYSTLLYAIEKITTLENNISNTSKELENVKTLILSKIPDSTYDDITLPTTYSSPSGDVTILWTTSDPYTLRNNGIVINGRENIEVTLSAVLSLNKQTLSLSKKIVVLKHEFQKLPATNNVFSYIYTNSFESYSSVDLETIDVVNLCFASLLDGEVNVLSLGTIYPILHERRKSGIRVLICITGYNTGTIPLSNAASTKQGRERLANSIANAIEKYHFDGIDMDWEYPGFGSGQSIAYDRSNMALLMQEIHDVVKEKNSDYIVSGALPGGTGLITRYDIVSLMESMDYIHLMTYDMNSSSTTTHHTSFLKTVQTVDKYLSSGASRGKLTVGIAFYGKIYTIRGSGIMHASATSATTIDYEFIKLYLEQVDNVNIIRYWDSNEDAPYLYIITKDEQSNIIKRQFITYDDTESIIKKCQYAKSNQLAGVMFWEYSGNYGGELMEAINEGLKK